MAPGRATAHWRQRVGQRIGASVCPELLALGLFWAIDTRRDDLVAYLGRVRRDGVRAFRFRVPDGRYFVALLDTERRSAITVLAPDHAVRLGDGARATVMPGARVLQLTVLERSKG
ncbi:hypothetical protein [Pararhodobacter sp.]|uniref:hypothetical protein n=1 Tax=Pararhodobacter sp. TaxID=2127056 RepID=UPI002FDCBB52